MQTFCVFCFRLSRPHVLQSYVAEQTRRFNAEYGYPIVESRVGVNSPKATCFYSSTSCFVLCADRFGGMFGDGRQPIYFIIPPGWIILTMMFFYWRFDYEADDLGPFGTIHVVPPKWTFGSWDFDHFDYDGVFC